MAKKGLKSGAEKEATEIRKLKSFDLRLEGKSYRAIGEALDISECMAYNDVKAVLKSMNEDRKEDIEEMRAVENHRLDVLFDKVYATATDRQFNPFTEVAVKTCVILMKRRAELNGLNMPIKIAPTDPLGLQPWDGLVYNVPENPDKKGNGDNGQ